MASNNIQDRLKEVLKGDVLIDATTLEHYSRDASLFKVRPTAVVYPKDARDIEQLVRFVVLNQKMFPGLSITPRSAGTCMSGGAIGEGIILDGTKYLQKSSVQLETLRAVVEPGVFYRDFERVTLPQHVSMPVYPASKGLAAFGGMIMNNCGSENSLRYGQMRDFVTELRMVLANGQEYRFRKLTMDELRQKQQQSDFEGEIYRNMFTLLDTHYDVIKAAKPKVAKNSSGYALWDIYDKEAGTFDLTQLFTGSQGTLGILTQAEVRLVETKAHHRLVTLFFNTWDALPETVNELLPIGVQSMETFDDTTLKLGIQFMPEIAKKAGMSFLSFALQFWPEAFISLQLGGLPKLIVLVEIAEDSATAADKKVAQVLEALKDNAVHYRVISDMQEAEKFWIMRRESFNLLRQKVKNKQTVPFIEDFCVRPEVLPEFLPKLLAILKEYGIKANIAGHAGEGNLHIIPLMDLRQESERAKIVTVAKIVYDLIIAYKGTITAEHNDGIMRTPFVRQMFGDEIYGLFKQVKAIFDPHNIFNPGKKVDGTLAYLEAHIVGKD